MTAMQAQLDKVIQAVNDRLSEDIKISELPKIVETINSINTVQTYIKQFEITEQIESVDNSVDTVDNFDIEEEISAANDPRLNYIALARDELEDALMYYDFFVELQDETLNEISKDELRHSEYWLAKAREETPDSPELAELKVFHNSVLSKLV